MVLALRDQILSSHLVWRMVCFLPNLIYGSNLAQRSYNGKGISIEVSTGLREILHLKIYQNTILNRCLNIMSRCEIITLVCKTMGFLLTKPPTLVACRGLVWALWNFIKYRRQLDSLHSYTQPSICPVTIKWNIWRIKEYWLHVLRVVRRLVRRLARVENAEEINGKWHHLLQLGKNSFHFCVW